MNRRRTIATILFAAASGLLAALPALAQTLSIVPACARARSSAPPTLLCALQTFGNIAQLILGLSGALVLLMLVWGGFKMLTAFGESAKIDEGKKVIKNAVTGLVIVMVAGTLINYGMSFLVRNPAFKVVGSQCSGDKPDPNGPGLFVMVPQADGTGKITCVTKCALVTGYHPAEDPGTMTCFTAPDAQYCCRGAASSTNPK